mmetsp:Transcript_24644/g.45160  ORF Transcript_24644/g.45160 Transcript_24644/m.45160 type:complete len:96 (+) Transcript_24644:107-394(+)
MTRKLICLFILALFTAVECTRPAEQHVISEHDHDLNMEAKDRAHDAKNVGMAEKDAAQAAPANHWTCYRKSDCPMVQCKCKRDRSSSMSQGVCEC